MVRISTLLLLALFSLPGFAKSVFVAQNAAGAASGTSCANAYSVATLNAGWSGKIAAGDTLYVCGQISSQLQVLGSGTAGSPITITRDAASGGEFARSVWTGQSAALRVVGDRAYVRITGLTFRATSPTATSTGNAMSIDGTCDNCRIDNNKFGPFAARVGGEACSDNTCGLLGVTVGTGSAVSNNFEMDHNEFVQWGRGVDWSWSNGSNNWSFHDNVCHEVGSCIWVAGVTGRTINGVKIYNNEVYNLYPFGESTDVIHCDGLIHAHAAGGGAIQGLQVYNNYMHGATCAFGHTTTWIFIENNPPGGGNYIPNPLVYNNLIYTAGSNAPVSDGNIFFKYTYGGGAFNNTVKMGGGTGMNLQAVNGITIQNNIFDGAGSGYGLYDEGGSTSVNSDYNNFYTANNSYSPGTHGLKANPLLNSDGTLQSGSPSIDKGINDSTSCSGCTIAKNGVTRPQGNAYDMGAFEYTTTVQALQPPTNLTVTVK
jgi:hypothetical protein